MTKEEFRQYWKPARALMGQPGLDTHPSYKLASLLGIEYPKLGHWENFDLTDELKFKLEALLGPHGDTVAKILQIKNGGQQ